MLRDLRYAFRMLVKTPGFTIIAVLALALGIGTSTTIFSTVNALLIRPFPLMQNQDRLVVLSEYFPKLGDENAGVAFPDFLDWKKQTTTLDGLSAEQNTTFILGGGEVPDRYLGSRLSAETFSFLGVQPILGRTFRAEEDSVGTAPVALIGYDLWHKRFGADPSAVGQSLLINGTPTTIIGVMPKDWRYPSVSDLWMPLQMSEKEHPRGNQFLQVTGRLKPGVSLSQAKAELNAIAARLGQEHPDTNAGMQVYMNGLRDEVVHEFRALVLLVMGAVLFVHLIACSNVANLLLARGATRAKEVAVRLALGASRPQIVRQFFAESFLLGLTGSVLGLLLAVWGVDLMIRSIPVDIPFMLRFDFDWRMFAFAVGTGVCSSVIFGLFPSLQASRPHLLENLKEGGRSGSGGAKGQRTRNALVVAEVALALVLLIGAGLMMRSFMKLKATKLGMDPSNILTFRVGLPPAQYPDPQTPARFFADLIPKLANLPGVEAASATTSIPASGNIGLEALVLEGEPEPKQSQDARLTRSLNITPGFLKTCRIPLLSGRDFTTAATPTTPLVALIDEDAARLWFPNQDPVGKHLHQMGDTKQPPKWMTVVGVVKNVVYGRVGTERNTPAIYVNANQQPEPFMSVMMRTQSNPKSFVNAARATVLSVNRDIPIYKIYSMDEVVTQSFWEKRFFGSLFTVFAALALFLASLGLYGVMAYSVRQRTQEIGVRMALGAQTGDVLRLVTGQGMRLIGIGLGIGLLGSYFLTQLLAGNLNGISAHDPLSFTLVPVILALVGLLACYLPARTAMNLDPMNALRYE